MIQKLIDAYEFEREMYRRCIDTDIEIEKGRAKWDSGLWIRYKVFEDAITVAPKVEAEQTKHGRWITVDKGHHFYDWKCSVCGGSGRADYLFCPNCGSRMDLEGDVE